MPYHCVVNQENLLKEENATFIVNASKIHCCNLAQISLPPSVRHVGVLCRSKCWRNTNL